MIPVLPNLFVVTMHKAASTFVADVLLPSIAVRTAWYELYNLGSELIEFAQRQKGGDDSTGPHAGQATLQQLLAEKPLPESNMVVGRVYPAHLDALRNLLGREIPDPMNRMVVVRRDPRDALISLFWSIAKSHAASGVDPEHVGSFLTLREELGNVSVKEGVRMLLHPDGGGKLVMDEFIAITDVIRANPGIADLPYEALINSPRLWLSRFVAHGNFRAIVDHNWHTEMLMHLRPPFAENPGIHKRRMRPGNWREVFDDEMHEMLEAVLGDRMSEFGYTRDTEDRGLRSAA
jgi:hypothetical protein